MTREEALRVLGLKEGASRAEIIHAHRSLIKKVHPDHGGSDLLAQQVNEARRVLQSDV
jgi:curved DNA-binding protein CbpA